MKRRGNPDEVREEPGGNNQPAQQHPRVVDIPQRVSVVLTHLLLVLAASLSNRGPTILAVSMVSSCC